MTKHRLLYMMKWGVYISAIKWTFWIAAVFASRQLHNFYELEMPRFSWYWHPAWATTPILFFFTCALSQIEYNPTKSLQMWGKPCDSPRLSA
jgi:hypothetical protein